MNPRDGPNFFFECDFWESVKNNTCRLSSRERVRQVLKWRDSRSSCETLSVMSRPGFGLPTFLRGNCRSHVFYLNFDPLVPKLLKLFVIPDPFKIFRIFISWIGSSQIWVRWITCWQWFHGICFIPRCMPVVFQHFMQKHRNWTAHLPLSTVCFAIAQALYFIMLYFSEV